MLHNLLQMQIFFCCTDNDFNPVGIIFNLFSKMSYESSLISLNHLARVWIHTPRYVENAAFQRIYNQCCVHLAKYLSKKVWWKMLTIWFGVLLHFQDWIGVDYFFTQIESTDQSKLNTRASMMKLIHQLSVGLIISDVNIWDIEKSGRLQLNRLDRLDNFNKLPSSKLHPTCLCMSNVQEI